MHKAVYCMTCRKFIRLSHCSRPANTYKCYLCKEHHIVYINVSPNVARILALARVSGIEIPYTLSNNVMWWGEIFDGEIALRKVLAQHALSS